MNMKATSIIRLATAGLLWAAPSWAGPVPEGAMADYHLQCAWVTYSEPACEALADRLGALERPARDERLALLGARQTLAAARGGDTPPEHCAGVRALVRDHPDYAEAVYRLAVDCSADRDELMARLRRALAIEPDNYHALSTLLALAEGLSGEGPGPGAPNIAPETLGAYREALYGAARERTDWLASVYPNKNAWVVWQDMFAAAGRILAAADRAGDHDAAATRTA